MAAPKYTVAISNYNMVETLAASLTSVLEQLDDRFEVVVVDDGSDDGSVDILERLEREYDILRVITDAGNDNLGEARNHSFKLADGEYVLSAVDTDDQFTHCIPDFVNLYHELEDAKDGAFLLLASGLYIAPRELVLETPYRSLGYGEDRDFYRRLLAKGALLSISHLSFRHSLGYDRSFVERFKIGIETIVVQFQSGLAFGPYLHWSWEEFTRAGGQLERHRGLAHLILAPVAYLISLQRPQYETPKKFRDIGKYKQALRDAYMTLSEMEQRYGVEVDREAIGARGCALFDIETTDEILD